MSPIKKRLRKEHPLEDNDTEMKDTDEDLVSSGGAGGGILTNGDASVQKALEKLVGKIQTQVSTLTTTDNLSEQLLWPIQKDFLSLKNLQRTILQNHEVQMQETTEEIQQQAKQEAQLQALLYEKAHLQQRISRCLDFRTPHLESIAKGELAEEDAAEEGNPPSSLTGSEAIKQYLGDVQDPSQKQHIIDKLHNEKTTRGSLETQIKEKTEELQDLMNEIEKHDKFLKGLPEHVDRLEKASLNLQKFVHDHSSDPSNRQIGSERASRFQAAAELAPPLFTLFQNLQHTLDMQEQRHVDDKMIVDKNGDVVLRFYVPKVASVVFQLKEGQVWAKAAGTNTLAHLGILLDDLFPNDTPIDHDDRYGRPYHWCNCLSGIINPGKNMKASTRVIVRELRSRLSSNVALKRILSSWSKRKWIQPADFPPYSLDDMEWDQYSLDESDPRKARASLQFRKSPDHTLKLSVCIDLVLYPGTPPRWSLNEENMYEERYAAWEKSVNLEMIEHNVGTGSFDRETFDWILVQQLIVLLKKWKGEEVHDLARPYRGRNRIPNDPMDTD